MREKSAQKGGQGGISRRKITHAVGVLVLLVLELGAVLEQLQLEHVMDE